MGGVDDDCVVCHRPHGDFYDSVCGIAHDVDGRESRPRACPEGDRFVCLEDCQRALRKAIQVLSAVLGSDAREPVKLHKKLEETRVFISEFSMGGFEA